MNRRLCGTLLVVFSLVVMTSVQLFAHHSFDGEFDGKKLVTLTGKLVKVEWQNPHGWLHMEVPDANGKLTPWQIEFSSPNVMTRNFGITRGMLEAEVGKVVSLNACPARNLTNKGAVEHLKFTNGTILQMGGKRYSGELDSVAILKNLK